MDFADTVEESIRNDLKERRERGERFSLTIDEWTGQNNKRFLNINIHKSDTSVHHLGLVRVKGSMSAEVCLRSVVERLAHFDIEIKTDIVCCTSDAAAVMTKFGSLIECEQQLCYTHGVHLAVCDILYSKQTLNVEQCHDEDSHSEDENDEDLAEAEISWMTKRNKVKKLS
jgi:hypothetical protein